MLSDPRASERKDLLLVDPTYDELHPRSSSRQTTGEQERGEAPPRLLTFGFVPALDALAYVNVAGGPLGAFQEVRTISKSSVCFLVLTASRTLPPHRRSRRVARWRVTSTRSARMLSCKPPQPPPLQRSNDKLQCYAVSTGSSLQPWLCATASVLDPWSAPRLSCWPACCCCHGCLLLKRECASSSERVAEVQRLHVLLQGIGVRPFCAAASSSLALAFLAASSSCTAATTFVVAFVSCKSPSTFGIRAFLQ